MNEFNNDMFKPIIGARLIKEKAKEAVKNEPRVTDPWPLSADATSDAIPQQETLSTGIKDQTVKGK